MHLPCSTTPRLRVLPPPPVVAATVPVQPGAAPAGAPRAGEVAEDVDATLVASSRRPGGAAAQAELLARYRPLARSMARRATIPGADAQDVVQEAMIGLFHAVRDFDASRGVPFAAFAQVCVRRQVLTAVEAGGRYKHLALTEAMSLDVPVAAASTTTLGDVLPAVEGDPADVVLAREGLRELGDFCRRSLTRLELRVLVLRADGRSPAEIAETLSLAGKSVDNALLRARRKLASYREQEAVVSA